MRVFLPGRQSIWWGWRVTLVAPRIVNNVAYVTWIKQANHFCVSGAALREKFKCPLSWQVQHL